MTSPTPPVKKREKTIVECRCGMKCYRSDLEHDSDIEMTHPSNRGKSLQDTDLHVTEAEKCPKCGRWIFADGRPTGTAKNIEWEVEDSL